MSNPRQNCLIVLSSSSLGVDAQSFIQSFTLAQIAFNVQICSIEGKTVEFVDQDETSIKWLNDFRAKSYSSPVSISTIEGSPYSAMLVPHSPGAALDLATDSTMAALLYQFVAESKPVCAVGMGVAALCGARKPDNSWVLANHCLTATSVFELAKLPNFSNFKLIPEDFIKYNIATYSRKCCCEDFQILLIVHPHSGQNVVSILIRHCSETGAVHVVIDRHIVTGQNRQSTSLAVQNLILLTNQRNPKSQMNGR